MKLNVRTITILLLLLGGAAGVSTSTWAVIGITDERYASSKDLKHTNLVVEEHILESKQINLNSQLTNIAISLSDKPINPRLVFLQKKLERALTPIDSKLADVRERLRLGGR